MATESQDLRRRFIQSQSTKNLEKGERRSIDNEACEDELDKSHQHKASTKAELAEHSVKLAHIQAEATDGAMRNHWTGGKFFIHPKVPIKHEEPKSVRELSLMPRSKESPEAVLRRHGTAVINIKGKKSATDTTVGQDMFSCTYLGNGWWLDLVADGHGTVGEFVADRISRTLPHFLNSEECSCLLEQDKIDEAYEIAFERTQKDVVETLGPIFGNSLMFAGSTCVCALRQTNSHVLHVAWVGDSKAILITPDGIVVKRTLEHKPENEVERKRVLSMGCEIVERAHGSGIVLQKVNVAGQVYPAISFTRSFGDQCVKELGVDAKPEIEHWDVSEGCFVLLASDGIFEFMLEEEVGKLIGEAMKRGLPAEEFLPELAQTAQQHWSEHEGEYCDDITALFLRVKPPLAQPPVPDTSCECFAGCCMM